MNRFIFFFALLFSIASPAQVYMLHERETENDPTSYCKLLPDAQGRFTVGEIFAGKADPFFTENRLHQHIFHAHDPAFNGWGKLAICNPFDSVKSVFLSPSKDVDTGYVYWKENGVMHSGIWGSMVKTKDRTFPRISMNIAPHDTLIAVMKFRGDDFSTINNQKISMKISDPASGLRINDATLVIFGIFYGMLIGLICYSLAVYFVIHKPIYLYFIAFSVSVLLFYIKDNGIGASFLWGNGPLHILDKYGNNLVFGPLAIATGFTLCRKFLGLKEAHLRIDRIIAVLVIVQCLPFLRLFIGFHELIRLLQNTLVVVMLLLLVIVSISMAWKKNSNAMVFLPVFLFAIIGVSISALRYSQFLPSNLFTQYAGQFGIGITALTFSLAIGSQIRQINKGKRQAEKDVFEKSKALEQLMKEQNILLEQKVEERTKELKEAQDELVRQEKLASLGKLADGIAHEMQNPLNFVNNFSAISIELLEEYKVAKTEEEKKAILDTLRANQEKINEHGSRAAAIVKAMFAHLRERKDQSPFGEKNPGNE
jgi:hypothetical protein